MGLLWQYSTQEIVDWKPTPELEINGRKFMLCVYGGIIVELFILSFQTAIGLSMQTYNLNSCNMRMKIFLENNLHSSVGKHRDSLRPNL